MATIQIPITGFGLVPDTSENVFLQPLSLVAPTNDLYDVLGLTFADTATKDEVNGSFVVPQDYAGTAASIVIIWTAANGTTNSVVWDFDYNSLLADGTESADPSAHTEAATATGAHGGTTMDINSTTITLTHGNLAAGDLVLFQLGRDGVSGSDNLAADALMLAALFKYDT